jgi:hypothetical protein
MLYVLSVPGHLSPAREKNGTDIVMGYDFINLNIIGRTTANRGSMCVSIRASGPSVFVTFWIKL